MANPIRRQWPYWIWSDAPNLLTTTLGGAPPPAPFFQTSWPNPLVPAQENRGFVRAASVQLIGQDKFFAAPGQAPAYDWPNPLRSPQRPQADSQSSLLVGPLAVPFQQLDWRNPARDRALLQPDLALNRLPLTSVVAAPFFQTDWPVPHVPRQSQENRGFLHTSDVRLIGQDRFFGAAGQAPIYDWPSPQQVRHPVQPGIPPNTLPLTFTVVAAPFFQADWPNPPPVRRPGHEVALNLLPLTIVAAPFHQTDWPVPSAPRYPQENRGFVRAASVQLIGQDRFFAAPGQAPVYDYPNPLVPRQPQENRGFIRGTSVWLIGQDRLYGAPGEAPTYDWPLPQRPRYPVQPEHSPLRPIVVVAAPIKYLFAPFSVDTTQVAPATQDTTLVAPFSVE